MSSNFEKQINRKHSLIANQLLIVSATSIARAFINLGEWAYVTNYGDQLLPETFNAVI